MREAAPAALAVASNRRSRSASVGSPPAAPAAPRGSDHEVILVERCRKYHEPSAERKALKSSKRRREGKADFAGAGAEAGKLRPAASEEDMEREEGEGDTAQR